MQETTYGPQMVVTGESAGMSWVIVLLIVIGVALAVGIVAMSWRAGRGRGFAALAIVTAIALLGLGATLVLLRLASRPEHIAPHWALGLKSLLLLLAGVVLGAIGILVVRFFAWLAKADPAGGAVNAEERKRIMDMIQQGKMTGAEGAELLDALGKSSALRGQQTFSRLDIAILAAFLITVLGFLLPWGRSSNIIRMINAGMLPVGTITDAAGYESGTLGWIVIVAALLGALLVFITPKEHLYKLALLQMLCFSVGLAGTIAYWCRVGTDIMPGLIVSLIALIMAIVASTMRLKAMGR